MRRSGTHNDFSQVAQQPQKKTLRRCYSETSLRTMDDGFSDNSQKPKHPLLGIPASVFMMPAKARSKEILHYPKTPDRPDSPGSSFMGSPKQVPTSPSQIPIPISKSLCAMTKEANPLKFSSSSESLYSMMEKSTIDARARKSQQRRIMEKSTMPVDAHARKPPQRTRSMENLQHGRSEHFLATNKPEKTKNGRKKRSGSKRRSGHNQTERSRMLKIRTAISDIKKILEEAGVTVHREKVKILQSALTHMRHLKEVLGQCRQRHSNLCMRVQQFQQMEKARRLGPMNNPIASAGAVQSNAVQHQMPMDRMPRDMNPMGMQMPSMLQQQHPAIVPVNYDVSMNRQHPHLSPHIGPHMSPPHMSPHMSPRMGPADVVGPDGMLDSMEPPLKFEEDEAWDNAPPQEDPFMSFFPPGAASDPAVSGEDRIDVDDMQLPDLMAMLDSGIPGQTRVTSSIDTFL